MIKERNIIWDYLDTGGQIIKILVDGPVTAGEFYKKVSASQPVISKKLAKMESEGIIESRRDRDDRRVVWYALSDAFRVKLLGEPDETSPKEPQPFKKS